MDVTDIRFERHCRTPYSEAFQIFSEGEETGRIDLHYGQNVVYGTLTVLADLEEEQVFELIEVIDERLVLAADVLREDFVITVFKGKQIGVYSDDSFDGEDEDDEEDEEEFGRNGR